MDDEFVSEGEDEELPSKKKRKERGSGSESEENYEGGLGKKSTKRRSK